MTEFNLFLKDLKELISYKSLKGEKIGDAPFGEQIKKALNFFLSKAKAFGFKTINYDNYMGEIVFGEGEEIGIIGHLDVVPEGSGWETDPYILTEKDGVYYGRGLADDKTPLLICLYILKDLKDKGVMPKRKIRLFLGCDEESGWTDVDYVKSKTSFPVYGFSPDGDFPVSYAEKGMAIVEFKLPAPKKFKDVSGGTVINAVCAYAKATANKDGVDESLIYKHGLMLKDNNVIESLGEASHGSRPELGKNAIKPLLCYMCDLGEDYLDAIKYLFEDKWGLTEIETEQGKITISPDIISVKDGTLSIKCDLRFPAPVTVNEVKKVLDKSGLDYSLSLKHGTHLAQKDGFLVQILLNAYNSIMKKAEAPISQGGSTFARVFEKGVAFGPEFPNKNASIHEANEHLSKEDVFSLYDIYYKAIYELVK